MTTHPKNNSLILIFGPTAVGKTALLLNLFQKNTEIISADSMQVYKQMDIGTAKPSSAELEAIAHHLIDIIEPTQQFHAAHFIEMADEKIREIHKRGNRALISGGTGYYFKNFLYGLPEVPPTNSKVSNEIEKRLKNGERAQLFEELKLVDSISAKRIHPNDSYRLVRALEVYQSSGKPLSSYKIPTEIRNNISPIIIGLTRDREELYNRIDNRVDLMFKQGLPLEIEKLIKLGYTKETAGMRAIGYQEFFMAKEQNRGDDFEYISNEIKKNSRHYAKRQITFFKKIPNVNWIKADDFDSVRELLKV